jgi:hypothetical protein
MEFFVVNFFEVLVRLSLKVIKKMDIRSMSIGYTLTSILDNFFDYVVYTAVIIYCGPFRGGLVMIVISAIVSLIYIKGYDVIKKDWMGIEAIKEIREEVIAENKWIAWLVLKGRWAEFLFVSCKWDPFITTAYMRAGVSQYNGMSRQDWKVFWLSLIVSNLWWILVIYTGISIATNLREILLVAALLTNAFFEGRTF